MIRTTYHDIHTDGQIGNVGELFIHAPPGVNEYLHRGAAMNGREMDSGTGQPNRDLPGRAWQVVG